jgi:hypothetical protein
MILKFKKWLRRSYDALGIFVKITIFSGGFRE